MNVRTSTCLCAGATLAAATLSVRSAPGASACGSDLDASGHVNSVDVALLLGQWMDGGLGPCPSGVPADLNDDCRVDGSDLAMLLAEWGPTPTFDFGPALPDDEASQIALEMLGPDGPLLPTVADYQRVVRDLALIRAFEPRLAGATHGPLWNPTRLHVLQDASLDQSDIQCLVNHYQAHEEWLPSCFTVVWRKITVPRPVNIEALREIFAADGSVVCFSRYGFGGSAPLCYPCNTDFTQGAGGLNFWGAVADAAGVWRWTVRKGNFCFGPQEVWDFETGAEGTVLLKKYQGPETFAGIGCAD